MIERNDTCIFGDGAKFRTDEEAEAHYSLNHEED